MLLILSGKTTTVIQTLESLVQDPTTSDAQREVLNTTIGYYRRNLSYMRYDLYLDRGWPISSGVANARALNLGVRSPIPGI